MNPPSSGSIPLQEYRRDIPPGWIPGDASYPLRTYFDKLKLWYRIANVEDEAIGPLVAGRLYGRASTIAMSLRVPRPDGTFDVGDAALVRLAVDEVREAATNVIIQNHIPSGVQFLANALRTAFGQQDQDLATQALDKFFGLARGKLSLSEYSVEFDSRYDDAHGRAGLQLNDVAGDYTRFNDARALALRVNPNRRDPDDAQILFEENDESYGDYDAYYQDWGDDYEAEDSWWYGYEEADEGEWVYEEYANDETYYENHDASDESWQEVDLEAGMTSGSASDSNVSGEYNEAYYKGKGNGSDEGCFNCGSKFHRVRDCPLGKGKNKKGSHNYKGKGKSKGFWRWRPDFKGKSKGKSKYPWRSKGKGKGKGFGRKGHYYAYQEEDNYKPRGGLSISEGIPDASTPQEVATSPKEVKTTKRAESFVIHTSSEDEDFKKPTDGYSGQPEYTTKDRYDKKLKMNFMVFNMKKEETQMSYHTIHGQERYGLLIDLGAASGLVGSEALRMLKSCSMGEMEINRNKITPVSGISGNSESTLGEVTLTMATAGQPITYTAEVIGGAGSLCPALVGNPTLRRLGASILTDWFENGDGMLVLNTKDAMDAEVNHVKFFRILLTDSGHYILPCDNVQNEKVPRASKHEAIAFFQKITEITSKVWPDVQPRVRHCFHSQTAAEDDRCDYNRGHERDKGPMKSQDHDVGCDHLACENGEEDELRNSVPSRKIHFIDEEQQKKSEEPYDLMNSEKNKSLSPIAEERDSEDEVSPSAILAEQCMKNDKSKEPAKNSNHLINEHPAGPAILAPAIHDEQGLREASYDEEKNVFLSYTGDMIPETADQAKLKKRYKAIPEEFYTKSGLTPVTPKNFDSWFKRVRGRGLRWHFWELFSGSGRLSLTLLLAGLMLGFPVDYRYGWDMRVASHRGMIHAAYEEFQPGVLHMSPDCAPWSVAASTKDPDEKMCERLQDRPALQLCQDLSARQDANGRGYNIEQPYGAQSWQELPENPLRLQRIPGNKSRQRVDQCMHGAQDEHGYPIMKPTGFGSNLRWKHTGLRCGGPRCQRMKQDIIQYLSYMNLLKLKTWPQDAYAVTLGHYYDCVRCQLGRHCPRNIEHTLVPGQCRHGRWPSEENPRRKKKLEAEMDAMKKWKQEAEAELYEGVEIKNLTSKALSVPTTHMLKKLLLETINATMGVFNEAARRKIDYVHWLDNPMLMSLFKEFFKDLIQVKGVKIELRPFHLASAEPKLPLTSSYLRMQVRGNVKAWDIHPPEDLREMSFSQINAALDEDDWAITIYGVEHDMAPSPSTPASRPRTRPDEPGIVQPAQNLDEMDEKSIADLKRAPLTPPVVLDRPGDPAERDPTQIAPYEDEELQTKSVEEIKPLKPNYNLRRVLVRIPKLMEDENHTKVKRDGKWRFFPREDDHATKIMLWVQYIYKGLSKHQVHGALLGRSLRNIKPPSNTVGHLISWIHGGQGYAVQEHFSDGFLKMKRVSNYSREEMCTIYLFHYHPDPVEEPASQSTINKDDDKMDVNVPDDRGEKRDAPETRTVVMAPEKKRQRIYNVKKELDFLRHLYVNMTENHIIQIDCGHDWLTGCHMWSEVCNQFMVEQHLREKEKLPQLFHFHYKKTHQAYACLRTAEIYQKMLAAMMPTLAFGTLVDAQSTEPENQEQKSYFFVYLMIFITVILAVMLERMVTSWMSKKRRIQPVKIESDDDDDMDVDQEGDQPSSSGASFHRKRKASPRDTWEDLARKVIDEKETLKRKNKKSEEDAHLQQQEIDSLKFDNEWWKDKYEKLEEKYDDKDFELKNLKNDMTVVTARKKVLESTVSDMRAGLVKLEDENAELKMKLDRKTAASSERPAPPTPRITDNAEMAGEIEKLQKMVKFKDQEIMRHLARIKSLEMPETIFITKTGKKFHREGCPHLREGEQVRQMQQLLWLSIFFWLEEARFPRPSDQEDDRSEILSSCLTALWL
ncbi:1-alkyl-2-acetylglycerophosphocholine esterase [Durusdinium trenchii]|uniref:1-alkyl-2-acetylglycerophosphocholine esterase n=1 Tax=Durusdinium trenchii TaxID=1381693 RepID=A0ABP0PVJ2_9DINO